MAFQSRSGRGNSGWYQLFVFAANSNRLGSCWLQGGLLGKSRRLMTFSGITSVV